MRNLGSSATRLLFLAPLALASCTDPATFLPRDQAGGPAGVLEGTVTYAGKPPCTEGGHIVGAGILEVFDVRLLPPPEGLGTSAASLAVVPGDLLFDGIRDQLTFNKDDSRWCPKDTADPVTVSAPWSTGPLTGGVYEVRGFYDRDGNFDPVIGIFKMPTRGDVAGGAIENAAEVLQGKPPVYRMIQIGDEQSDGSYAIPDLGVRVNGVTVTFGLPMPLDPPIFYSKSVTYSDTYCAGDGDIQPYTAPNDDPSQVTMPSDYWLPVFSLNPAASEKSLIRVNLGAGVPQAEIATATSKPFNLPVKSPKPFFQVNWQDVDGNGVPGDGSSTGGLGHVAGDHVPDSDLIPSLYPLAIFTRLEGSGDKVNKLVAQSSPVVLLQGLTIYKSLLETVTSPATLSAQVDEITIGLRPAVLCIDPNDATSPVTLLVTHDLDCAGTGSIPSSEDDTKDALEKQFRRDVNLVYGCLPEGSYAMNLIYSTGQAWTVPNEAGVCQPAEKVDDAHPGECGDYSTGMHRPLIESQSVVVTIGKPRDAQYCKDHPTPAACLPAPKK